MYTKYDFLEPVIIQLLCEQGHERLLVFHDVVYQTSDVVLVIMFERNTKQTKIRTVLVFMDFLLSVN